MANCGLCGGNFYKEVLLDENLFYDHCESCKSFSQRSSLGLKDTFERSQEEYHSGDPDEIFSEPSSISNERWTFRTRLCEKYLTKKSAILEVGPGRGTMAEILIKGGFSYKGCEHSSSFANYLINKGLDIITGSFEDAQFDLDFDAVISMHVIEHLCTPDQHLERAYQVTKPGGIMILCTPNADSFYHKLPYKFASNFDEAHLYVFSTASLTYMAEKAGWSVQNVSTHEYTSDWLRLISRLLRLLKGENAGATAGNYAKKANIPIIDKIIWVFSCITSPFRWLQANFGLGNELIFVLKKPDDSVLSE